MEYPHLAVAHYDNTAEMLVQADPLDGFHFVLARFGAGRGAGEIEVSFRNGRLELRAVDGVLEIAPAAANTVHVQVRTPFGDVHGAQRDYEKQGS